MFCYLGPVIMGFDAKTGPNALSEKLGNSFARHDVIRGKPVVQKIGRELDNRELKFFFDETFCTPELEWAKLVVCYEAQEALPFISGNAYDGRRFLVETLTRDVQKTSRSGRVVRVEITMTLIEAPVPSLLDMLLGTAAGAASAVGSGSSDPEVRK